MEWSLCIVRTCPCNCAGSFQVFHYFDENRLGVLRIVTQRMAIAARLETRLMMDLRAAEMINEQIWVMRVREIENCLADEARSKIILEAAEASQQAPIAENRTLSHRLRTTMELEESLLKQLA